jgi:glycosyltransferase involved in cell wall biosynthesis
MRVCFLGGTRYRQPLEATAEKKFRALASLGEMTVVGFASEGKPCAFTQQARFYLLPQLPLPVLRYVLLFAAAPFLALWCILRHGVRILVAQSPYEGAAAVLAKILAGILGRRVALIVESHGDFEASLFMQRRVSLASVYRFLMRRTARFALRRADALRAVSKSTRQQLEHLAFQKPIVQFPAWTDIEPFLKAGSRRLSSGDARAILYAGVLIPRKGVHFLLEAFTRLHSEFPAARLCIIGNAENPDYAASLKEQALRLGLDGRVTFLDSLPQRQLAAYMAQAEVFVLPSESEGLGRVIFEAMAAGTPAIGSQVGGIPEMIKHGVTGFLVPAKDPAALADSLRWMLEHPREARQMGERARAFAQEFFSPHKYVRHYARLFQLASQALDR